MNDAYIAIGSNINPEKNIKKALALLAKKAQLVRLSPVYTTPPMGYADQADFLNMAVLIATNYDAAALRYQVLDWIENELKRVRDPNNKAGPRTIDLDIALWNDETFSYGHKPWQVPHDDVTTYGHTALPLADIAPNYQHPSTGETLAAIAQRVPAEGIIRRDDLTFTLSDFEDTL